MDTLTKKQRSKLMASIGPKNTKLEDKVLKKLWSRGIRYRRNTKGLMGKPDIAIKKYKVVIFIDSCFWHGCEIHGRIPKSRVEFWTNKIKQNKQRDNEVTRYYIKNNWNILRIWEHEINQNLDQVVNEIVDFIENQKGRCKI